MAWPMVVAMGAAALMKQDAKNKAQAEYNWWKNRKDKNTVKALRIQAGNARQGVADLTRQKINTEEITAET